MSHRKLATILWGGLIVWLLLSLIPPTQAQRATPTYDPGVTVTASPTATNPPGGVTVTPSPTATASPGGVTVTPTSVATSPGSTQRSGSIQGKVYEDVNGDGKCIGTAVSGEVPLANITIEFVSSDQQTIVALQTAADGTYALVAAGYSYWAVSPKPASGWLVSSAATLYAPVYEDSLVVTDINFCLQRASRATVLLPASGGNGLMALLPGVLIVGGLLLAWGIGWDWRKRHGV